MKSTAALCLILCLGLTAAKLHTSPEGFEMFKGATVNDDNSSIINNMTPAEAHAATVVPDFKGQTVNSGFVQVKDSGSSMYFISYSSQKGAADVPLILWLQGGPGCSSWEGNLGEMGPYGLVGKDGKIFMQPRENTWNEDYHLMFIDNPFGAGYSYVSDKEDYVTNEDQVAENLYDVLQVYFAKFPQYASNDFYIFGESYAGHYIPSIGKYILEQNESSTNAKINLKGLGIGDGWTDPITQLESYGYYAMANGLIDEKQYQEVKKIQDGGVQNIKDGEMSRAQSAMDASLGLIINAAGGVNEYNYRIFGTYADLNTPFLNQANTKAALHVPSSVTFAACDGPSYSALTNDFMASVKDKFPYVLSKIPVMLYNGQDDLIVNTPGAEAWIKTIDWPHKEDYLNAERSIWKNQDGEIAGYVRHADSLMQLVILKAGHMVPKDQIKNSQNMVDRFVSFADQYNNASFLSEEPQF